MGNKATGGTGRKGRTAARPAAIDDNPNRPVFGVTQSPAAAARAATQRQSSMFNSGEDMPLFTGTAQRVQEQVFNPVSTGGRQSQMFPQASVEELAAAMRQRRRG